MRGLNSPFDGILPHGVMAEIETCPKPKLQLPRKKSPLTASESKSRSKNNTKHPAKKVQCAKDSVADRTINLDAEPLMHHLPALDAAFWRTESPFIARATFLHQLSLPHHYVLDRDICCKGKAEERAALYLLFKYRCLLSEQPFRVRYKNRQGSLDFISAPKEPYLRQERIPWATATVWEVKDTSLFTDSATARKQRSRLKAQIEQGLALSLASGCNFAVLFVQIPGRPVTPAPDELSRELGCKVCVVSHTTVRNLLLLKRYEVPLAGRDDALLDSILHFAEDTVSRRSFTAVEVAKHLKVSLGKISYTLLHAAQHAVCVYDMENYFSVHATQLYLDPDWSEHLADLRQYFPSIQ